MPQKTTGSNRKRRRKNSTNELDQTQLKTPPQHSLEFPTAKCPVFLRDFNKDIIKRRPWNHQVDVIFVNPSQKYDLDVDESFYVHKFRLAEFIQPTFIQEHVSEG